MKKMKKKVRSFGKIGENKNRGKKKVWVGVLNANEGSCARRKGKGLQFSTVRFGYSISKE